MNRAIPCPLPSARPPVLCAECARNASMEKLHIKGMVTIIVMKEQLIIEKEEVLSDKNTSDQRSILLKMVHFIAVGLSLLVIWLAQPGSSKFCSKVHQL